MEPEILPEQSNPLFEALADLINQENLQSPSSQKAIAVANAFLPPTENQIINRLAS